MASVNVTDSRSNAAPGLPDIYERWREAELRGLAEDQDERGVSGKEVPLGSFDGDDASGGPGDRSAPARDRIDLYALGRLLAEPATDGGFVARVADNLLVLYREKERRIAAQVKRLEAEVEQDSRDSRLGKQRSAGVSLEDDDERAAREANDAVKADAAVAAAADAAALVRADDKSKVQASTLAPPTAGPPASLQPSPRARSPVPASAPRKRERDHAAEYARKKARQAKDGKHGSERTEAGDAKQRRRAALESAAKSGVSDTDETDDDAGAGAASGDGGARAGAPESAAAQQRRDRRDLLATTRVLLGVVSAARERAERPRTFRESVHRGLRAAIEDPESGVLTLRGTARAELRGWLVQLLFVLSRSAAPFLGSLNVVLTGPSGSGKTKAASVIAHVLKSAGILVRADAFRERTATDLVSQFVGESGQKTRALLRASLEGVTLVDEAYALAGCSNGVAEAGASRSGLDAISELVAFLEPFNGLTCIVLAGYEADMKCLMATNEGLARRFPKWLRLPPYSVSDLVGLFAPAAERGLALGDFRPSTLGRCERAWLHALLRELMARARPPAVGRATDGMGLLYNQAGDMQALAQHFLLNAGAAFRCPWTAADLATRLDILADSVEDLVVGNKGLVRFRIAPAQRRAWQDRSDCTTPASARCVAASVVPGSPATASATSSPRRRGLTPAAVGALRADATARRRSSNSSGSDTRSME